jgi:protein phosphatase
MRAAACSDIGKTRKINEDNYCLVKNENQDMLAAVFDGIGGSKAGEVASLLAKETFEQAFAAAPVFTKDYEVNDFIQSTMNKANDLIYSQSLNNPLLKGMGTTCVGILLTSIGPYIFNVGDSRLYAKYSDGFIQMSEDHSVIARLLRQNKISQEEAKVHTQRNTLTNALGIWKVFRIDINKIHDNFTHILICSDGLSGYVEKQEIESVVLNDTLDTAAKCSTLINLANEAGGMDNCTVIVMDHFEDPAQKEIV